MTRTRLAKASFKGPTAFATETLSVSIERSYLLALGGRGGGRWQKRFFLKCSADCPIECYISAQQ